MKQGCLGFCFAMLLLGGCAKQAAIPKAIQGLYSPGPQVYAGETIQLADGTFTCKWFTDALSDPKLKENPSVGHFTVAGSQVTLMFSNGHTSHLLLTKGSAGYMLWTDDEYKTYLSTKKVPFTVLYQQSNR